MQGPPPTPPTVVQRPRVGSNSTPPTLPPKHSLPGSSLHQMRRQRPRSEARAHVVLRKRSSRGLNLGRHDAGDEGMSLVRAGDGKFEEGWAMTIGSVEDCASIPCWKGEGATGERGKVQQTGGFALWLRSWVRIPLAGVCSVEGPSNSRRPPRETRGISINQPGVVDAVRGNECPYRPGRVGQWTWGTTPIANSVDDELSFFFPFTVSLLLPFCFVPTVFTARLLKFATTVTLFTNEVRVQKLYSV